MKNQPCACGRRRFLGIGVTAFLLLPFTSAFGFLKKKAETVKLPLSKLPQIKEVGAGIIIKIKKTDLLLIRTAENKVQVLDPTCRHKKCDVLYEKDWGEIRCDCHGSKYTTEGKVKKPPSKKNLKRYPATLKDDALEVTLQAEEWE